MAASSPTMLRRRRASHPASYVHFACTKLRHSTVTRGQQHASGMFRDPALIAHLRRSEHVRLTLELVVRGRVELPTFR